MGEVQVERNRRMGLMWGKTRGICHVGWGWGGVVGPPSSSERIGERGGEKGSKIGGCVTMKKGVAKRVKKKTHEYQVKKRWEGEKKGRREPEELLKRKVHQFERTR